jgi:mono/diheme cytochrome c family protein
VLAAARAHWADHCASCHANDGSGQTEMGKLMYPRPPDMRLAGTQGLTDGALYAVIKNGIRLTGMPAWGEPGNADLESWKLVAFIRQLPLLTPADLREMAKMNPVSPMEQHEATAEEEFLNGGDEFPEDAGRAAH